MCLPSSRAAQRLGVRTVGSSDGQAEAEGIIGELAEAHGLPLVTGLPFGHVDRNRAWTVGARAVLDGDRGVLEQLESGVSQQT